MTNRCFKPNFLFLPFDFIDYMKKEHGNINVNALLENDMESFISYMNKWANSKES